MTAAVSSHVAPRFSGAGLRRQLEEPRLRARLVAMVRRRVPAADADDVVQAVLCDALAAAAAPEDDRELGLWIWGIARNKVADFHRRARRETPEGEERAVADGRGEARLLLAAVVADAAASPRGQETLDWIVREHAGDELSQIAREAELDAPVVRQRVSRLRRALRARWLGAGGALVLALVAGAGLARVAANAGAPETIVADPTGASTEAVLARIGGVWRVESGPAKGARVRIAGARVVVEIAGTVHERAIVVENGNVSSLAARLFGGGDERRVTARFDRAALVVTDGGQSVRLVRP